MKALSTLSLILTLGYALSEGSCKLNPFFVSAPLPNPSSYIPGHPLVDPYWFSMNYEDESSSCNSSKEYRKMMGSGPLCNCRLEELVIMGRKSVVKDGRVSCCLRSCFIGEVPLHPPSLLEQAVFCCAK